MKKYSNYIPWLAILAGFIAVPLRAATTEDRPNFVVIFADDLGYGDLSGFGHPTIRTPVLDRLANEGQKWTNFYASDNVCTPSRAALLTGRLPVRYGLNSNTRRVLFPDSTGGLPTTEITIARALKDLGYATACVGKWHLGHLPEFLPTSHGFDTFFGVPYSNDMNFRAPVEGSRIAAHKAAAYEENYQLYDVPLMRGEEEIERPMDQRTLTKRLTEEAVKRIHEMKDGPFFLYLAHPMPHVPLFRAPEFHGRSGGGIYGDVIEEIDWSVGEVVAALREAGVDSRTLVVFTSDNGPWLAYGDHGGSAGVLRSGKQTTWEGGHRVPAVVSWPGQLKPATIHEIGSTLDLLPSFIALAGGTPPEDRLLDGYDLSPVLLGTGPSPREIMYFYHGEELYALRRGPFKIHFTTQEHGKPRPHNPPLLYDLNEDPGEQNDVANRYPEVVAELTALAEAHRATVEPAEDQIERKKGSNVEFKLNSQVPQMDCPQFNYPRIYALFAVARDQATLARSRANGCSYSFSAISLAFL